MYGSFERIDPGGHLIHYATVRQFRFGVRSGREGGKRGREEEGKVKGRTAIEDLGGHVVESSFDLGEERLDLYAGRFKPRVDKVKTLREKLRQRDEHKQSTRAD